MKKFLIVTFLIASLFILPTPALAQGPSSWQGACVGGSSNDVATIQGLQCLLANVLSVALTIIGLAGFVMLIYGSFKFMLSGTNSQQKQSAGQTILYAVVGLILALSSFMIINIIAEFTGIRTITNFFIPDSEFNWEETLH